MRFGEKEGMKRVFAGIFFTPDSWSENARSETTLEASRRNFFFVP
jgi:hypothetical protein